MGQVTERNRTFFQGVERLPAGHWTRIAALGRVTRAYWAVSDAPRVAPQAEPEHRFRKLFDSAVGFQTADQREIATFLSGGLDSSSVMASVMSRPEADLKVLGLTRSYSDLPDWSDGRYIALMKSQYDFAQVELPGECVSPLDHAEKMIAANDGPVLAYGLAANVFLYEAARHNGIKVILDGHGGDEVVSFGMGLLNELAQRGAWLQLWQATRAAAAAYGGSRASWLLRYLVHNRIWRSARSLQRHSVQLSRGPSGQVRPTSLLAPDLEELAGKARYDAEIPTRRHDHTERDLHEFALGSPIQQYAQELLVLAARAYGVECRMPFMDRDLAEFCLSLEARTKLKNGLTRAILRDAMGKRLPPALLERTGKFDFSDAFVKSLLQDRERLMDLTDPSRVALAPFVNLAHLDTLRREVGLGSVSIDPVNARTLFRVAQLTLWLRSGE